jgi:hypothetical protein
MTSRFFLIPVAVLGFGVVGCEGESVDPVPVDPAHLEPPPTGQGFQVATEDIQVEPGNEVQDCYFFKVSDLIKRGSLPADQAANLHRIQIAQREGSHHMNIFRVRTIVGLDPAKGAIQKGVNGQGECFKSPNWADWPLIANSQQDGQLDWTFPDGVANALQPDEWIMLQTHYVNATSQKTPEGAHVTVNFWTLPKEQVKDQMGTLFATKQSIRICQSSPKPISFNGSCNFNNTDPVHVIGANAHFHSRGRDFEMFKWDGESTTTPPAADRFYQSQAWDDPPMSHSPELDIELPVDSGVYYTCSFEWTQPDPAVGCEGLNKIDKEKLMAPKPDGTPGLTEEEADAQLDCCYRFGPIVEKNEHCNIFAYFYPAQGDINCF